MKFFRKIRLSETDATGVIYFTELLKFATEAFEEFLEGKLYATPVASAKSSYLAPISCGEEIEITLALTKMGNRSFELHAEIRKGESVVGKTEIVHVFLGEAIPSELRERLERLR